MNMVTIETMQKDAKICKIVNEISIKSKTKVFKVADFGLLSTSKTIRMQYALKSGDLH